jgi:acyl-coenzyme A thioesterase PaaI-like protein
VTELAARIRAIKARYDGCFGCGPTNPFGLQLDGFRAHGVDAVRTAWSPRPEYRGFTGVLHGGIVTAALDEVMAWTAMLLADVTVVTGTIELRFSRPAPVDAVYTLEGRLADRRGRRLLMEARCLDADERPVASATAMFLVTSSIG